MNYIKTTALICISLLPATAMAHPGHGEVTGVLQGILHPLLGLDHLLALCAGGIWLSRLRPRNRNRAIGIFTAWLSLAVILGSLLPRFNVEPSIMASLVVTSVFLVASKKWFSVLGYSLMLAAVAIHGVVHGMELMPSELSIPALFGVALSSSLMLCAVALVASSISKRMQKVATIV